MAKVISSIPIHEVKNRGEREALEALERHQDAHFLVFPEVEFLRRHKQGGNLVDGEADIVVLDQALGVLLVLEVKEGVVSHVRAGDGSEVWIQSDHQMDTSPWSQVTGNKYELVEYVKQHHGWTDFPLSHGHALLLPDVHTPIGRVAPNITEDVSIIWSSPEELAEKVAKVSESWYMSGKREPSEHEIDLVRQALMPSFVYGNTLRDRIGVERMRYTQSSDSMLQLVEFTQQYKRVRVEGCAGSGKTSLAAAKARQLAEEEGRRILFLAYNREVVDYLGQCLKDCPSVTVSTFHAFCHERCMTAGMEWPVEGTTLTQDFWTESAPQMLDEALEKAPCVYDAILIDEAQDFQGMYWYSLVCALKPDGWYYIFYDAAQNLYKGNMEFPIEAPPFIMPRNCRSTRKIAEAISERTGKQLLLRNDLPEGAPVRVEKGASPAIRRRLLGKILHDWIRKEGLAENQIVVLGGHSLKNSSMENEEQVSSFRIKNRAVAAPGIISYHTYMSFKGCEADAVILLDVDPADERWNAQGLYTAMTRARHLLAIIEIE